MCRARFARPIKIVIHKLYIWCQVLAVADSVEVLINDVFAAINRSDCLCVALVEPANNC